MLSWTRKPKDISSDWLSYSQRNGIRPTAKQLAGLELAYKFAFYALPVIVSGEADQNGEVLVRMTLQHWEIWTLTAMHSPVHSFLLFIEF